MYNSYNTSNKKRNINSKFKNNLWYDNKLGKYPVVLPPIDTAYANQYKPIYRNKKSRYDISPYKLPSSMSHYPGSIARNPYLNPLFQFKYEQSDFLINNNFDSKNIVKTFEDDFNNVDDELDYQYEQRDWIKNKSKDIENDTTASKIKLIKGDVVNIDKKTLVFQYFNNQNRRHVFKELTTLKQYDYDLTTREYTIVIPSKLKYDIITPQNLIREIKYIDIPINEETELTEGYLSDLENGNKLLTIKEEHKLDIIKDYVVDQSNFETIYNIEKNISAPKIIIHENDTSEMESTARKIVDDIIETVVSKTSNKNIQDKPKEDLITLEDDSAEVEKINLDEDEPSTWGGWCSIS